MQSFKEAFARDFPVAQSSSLSSQIEVFEPYCLLYRDGDDDFFATYFARQIGNGEVLGVKVQDSQITDHYVMREGCSPNRSSKFIPNGFHCVEIEPDTLEVVSLYKLSAREVGVLEEKFDADGSMLQENLLCGFESLPEEYQSIVRKQGFDEMKVNGYKEKNGEKFLLLMV